MDEHEIPDVGGLLTPMIQALDEGLRPFFLSRLERGAAGRYRAWAEQVSDVNEREKLLACAAREEEIADRVEALFPVSDEGAATADAAVPEARDAYFSVFDGRSLEGQWRVQAHAERQGAMAWRMMATEIDVEATRQALEACSQLEETSAACLDELLANRS